MHSVRCSVAYLLVPGHRKRKKNVASASKPGLRLQEGYYINCFKSNYSLSTIILGSTKSPLNLISILDDALGAKATPKAGLASGLTEGQRGYSRG